MYSAIDPLPAKKKEFVVVSKKNIIFNDENIKRVQYHTRVGVCLSRNCKWCYICIIL